MGSCMYKVGYMNEVCVHPCWFMVKSCILKKENIVHNNGGYRQNLTNQIQRKYHAFVHEYNSRAPSQKYRIKKYNITDAINTLEASPLIA